jgi:hypothetical protein
MLGRGSSPFEAATFSRQTHFPENDEARFPPSGRGLEGNGPASLRVELDTGGSAFLPLHSRSSVATADWLSRMNCQSNSACRRVETRRPLPADAFCSRTPRPLSAVRPAIGYNRATAAVLSAYVWNGSERSKHKTPRTEGHDGGNSITEAIVTREGGDGPQRSAGASSGRVARSARSRTEAPLH